MPLIVSFCANLIHAICIPQTEIIQIKWWPEYWDVYLYRWPREKMWRWRSRKPYHLWRSTALRVWIKSSPMSLSSQPVCTTILSNPSCPTIVEKFIDTKRLPHLMFYGPPGTGKTTCIQAIARKMYGKSYKNMTLEVSLGGVSSLNSWMHLMREESMWWGTRSSHSVQPSRSWARVSSLLSWMSVMPWPVLHSLPWEESWKSIPRIQDSVSLEIMSVRSSLLCRVDVPSLGSHHWSLTSSKLD